MPIVIGTTIFHGIGARAHTVHAVAIKIVSMIITAIVRPTLLLRAFLFLFFIILPPVVTALLQLLRFRLFVVLLVITAEKSFDKANGKPYKPF